MIWSLIAARVLASSTVRKRHGVPFLVLQATPAPAAAAARAACRKARRFSLLLASTLVSYVVSERSGAWSSDAEFTFPFVTCMSNEVCDQHHERVWADVFPGGSPATTDSRGPGVAYDSLPWGWLILSRNAGGWRSSTPTRWMESWNTSRGRRTSLPISRERRSGRNWPGEASL